MGADGLPAGFPALLTDFGCSGALSLQCAEMQNRPVGLSKGGLGKGRRTFTAGEAATAPDIARAGLEGAARGCRGGCGGGGGDGRERKHGFNLVQWLPCEAQRLNSAFRHFPAPVVFFNARRIRLQGRDRKYPSRPATNVLKFKHGV